MEYGVVGTGEVPYEQLQKHLRRKNIVWRREGDHWEIYNYRQNRWVEMTKNSHALNEMMVLAGVYT